MTRFRRLALLAVVPVVLALATLALAAPTRSDTAASEVGTAPSNDNAIEIVARIDQDGAAFISYGYVTHIQGLNDAALFTDPINRSEATARFTTYSAATLTARSVISSVFALNAVGTSSYYYNPYAGATFNDPASFRAGATISTSSVRYQNVVNVQSANRGVATGWGSSVQETAPAFTFNGSAYQLGRPGLLSRIEYTGEGTRTDAEIPKSFFQIAGNVVTTGQRTLLPLIMRDGSLR